MNGVLLRAKMARLDSLARRLKQPCPTLQGQNVYVSCPRRIRFTLETYMFYSRYVYVATKQGIRSTEKPYALGDRRMEVDGGKGELIMGKTYSISREG